MAKWLVTGGCGFIGSHLVDELLRQGHETRALDNLSTGRRGNLPKSAELIVGDVADPDALACAAEGVDGIFHLAAVASVERCRIDWLGSHRTNLTGTLNVLAAARRAALPLPVVYASSAAVYGDSNQLPLSEVAPTRPLSAYGVDKLGGEWHAKVGWTVYSVPSVGLRLFNVYGPRLDPCSPYSGVIAIFADRIAANREIEIYSDGKQTRDFVFVSDVVAHFIEAMAGLRTGAAIFNVCSGRATCILDLAQTIGRIVGRRVIIRHRPGRKGDIRASLGDPAAARAALSLVAKTDIRDGLEKTLKSPAIG
jgi:UDP-glucose 4-epimerase